MRYIVERLKYRGEPAQFFLVDTSSKEQAVEQVALLLYYREYSQDERDSYSFSEYLDDVYDYDWKKLVVHEVEVVTQKERVKLR
jgi:hypothetical protein